MAKVTYIEHSGTEHVIEVPVGTTIMEGAVKNRVPGIDADCGGACACATCHVFVDAAWIEKTGKPGSMEESMLDFAEGVTPLSREEPAFSAAVYEIAHAKNAQTHAGRQGNGLANPRRIFIVSEVGSNLRSCSAVPDKQDRVCMIGVVVVSHGFLARELILAAEHVVGPQTNMQAICIGPDDDMQTRRDDILDACRKVDDGSGVIILTDMFGGTPSNLAISIMNRGEYELKFVGAKACRELFLLHKMPPGNISLWRHPCWRVAKMTERVSRTIEIINKRGLHARASSKFALLAGEFADSRVMVGREDQEVDGESIMDLMMLAAGIGSEITVSAEGPRAEAALDALCELVANRFGEAPALPRYQNARSDPHGPARTEQSGAKQMGWTGFPRPT
eukprot:gene8791-11873_t